MEHDKIKHDKIAENWPQIKAQVKAEWSKLTDQDLNVPKGDSQYLASKLQERYSDKKLDQAQMEVQKFSRTLN